MHNQTLQFPSCSDQTCVIPAEPLDKVQILGSLIVQVQKSVTDSASENNENTKDIKGRASCLRLQKGRAKYVARGDVQVGRLNGRS